MNQAQSFQEKNVIRKGYHVTCSVCNKQGHNKATCKKVVSMLCTFSLSNCNTYSLCIMVMFTNILIVCKFQKYQSDTTIPALEIPSTVGIGQPQSAPQTSQPTSMTAQPIPMPTQPPSMPLTASIPPSMQYRPTYFSSLRLRPRVSNLQIRSSEKHPSSGSRVGILYNGKDGSMTYCVSVSTYVPAWIPYMC